MQLEADLTIQPDTLIPQYRPMTKLDMYWSLGLSDTPPEPGLSDRCFKALEHRRAAALKRQEARKEYLEAVKAFKKVPLPVKVGDKVWLAGVRHPGSDELPSVHPQPYSITQVRRYGLTHTIRLYADGELNFWDDSRQMYVTERNPFEFFVRGDYPRLAEMLAHPETLGPFAEFEERDRLRGIEIEEAYQAREAAKRAAEEIEICN